MTAARSYRDVLARRGERKRHDGSPLWLLTDADLPSRTHPITVRTEKRV